MQLANASQAHIFPMQFFDNVPLATDRPLPEQGVKHGDEVAVIYCQSRTPLEALLGDEVDEQAMKQLPSREQVDSITAEEAKVRQLDCWAECGLLLVKAVVPKSPAQLHNLSLMHNFLLADIKLHRLTKVACLICRRAATQQLQTARRRQQRGTRCLEAWWSSSSWGC